MTIWRRLEGGTIDPEMTEGLSARIADPLWTLCRQWQVGEFHGEDAATPILIGAETETIPISAVQVGGVRRPTGPHVPLESYVERELVREGPAALRVALESGVALLGRLRRAGLDRVADELQAVYAPAPEVLQETDEDLDPVGAARLRMLGARSLDARRLVDQVAEAGGDPAAVPAIDELGADAAATADVVRDWLRAEDELFAEPGDARSDGWINDRMEYRFGVVAEGKAGRVLLAGHEYTGGALDWYDVDVLETNLVPPSTDGDDKPDGPPGDDDGDDDHDAGTLPSQGGPGGPGGPGNQGDGPLPSQGGRPRPGEQGDGKPPGSQGDSGQSGPGGPGTGSGGTTDDSKDSVYSIEVLASPLKYAGQPASRFWEFEDGDVAFGDLAGGPEDLARSVIASYAAVGGDDWSLVPMTLPIGSLARTRDVWVLDNFESQRHAIQPTAVADVIAAEQGLRPQERPWRFFELTGDPGPTEGRVAPMLFLPPVVDTLETSRPLEAVEFRRDEMANLAWGIERRVESAWGRPVDRDAEVAERPDEVPGRWDFTLLTSVPPSWVPLVPVQRPADLFPQMVLRRGTLAVDDPALATDARSAVLSETSPFILQEEEVPNGGLRVARRWQMARDHDGGIHLWVGRTKRPASGPMRRTPLVFDEMRTPADPVETEETAETEDGAADGDQAGDAAGDAVGDSA